MTPRKHRKACKCPVCAEYYDREHKPWQTDDGELHCPTAHPHEHEERENDTQ